MPLLPKSRTARRRLGVVTAAAVVLVLAVVLTIIGVGEGGNVFYSPVQAMEAKVPPGRSIKLGGLVAKGSVKRFPDGTVHFVISDNTATARVVYHGELPDLFREGQGVMTTGAFDKSGVFKAKDILARHDEAYMPKEVADALKEAGEWKGDVQKMNAP